jgi:ADP-ribose pyrophosphatase YjhB (NUDIX family)
MIRKTILAAGTIFISKKTKRYLLNYRSDSSSHPNCWGFWGGKLNENETIFEGLDRECREELGEIPNYSKIQILDEFKSIDGKFKYYSFAVVVEDEFIPNTNKESMGYCWIELGHYPKPLHPGARTLLENKNIIKVLKELCA